MHNRTSTTDKHELTPETDLKDARIAALESQIADLERTVASLQKTVEQVTRVPEVRNALRQIDQADKAQLRGRFNM